MLLTRTFSETCVPVDALVMVMVADLLSPTLIAVGYDGMTDPAIPAKAGAAANNKPENATASAALLRNPHNVDTLMFFPPLQRNVVGLTTNGFTLMSDKEQSNCAA